MTDTLDVPPTLWQDLIIGITDEDPATLIPNPANFRRHPPSQAQAFDDLQADVGFIAPVIVNDRTGYLIDGHLRRERAIATGQPTIKTLHVDLPPEKEATALATFDPVGAMAYADAAAFALLASSTIDAANTGVEAIIRMQALRSGVDLSGDWGDLVVDQESLVALGDRTILEGQSREDTFDRYESTTVRQIVLIMDREQYADMLGGFREIMHAHGLDHTYDVVRFLLDEYRSREDDRDDRTNDPASPASAA